MIIVTHLPATITPLKLWVFFYYENNLLVGFTYVIVLIECHFSRSSSNH